MFPNREVSNPELVVWRDRDVDSRRGHAVCRAADTACVVLTLREGSIRDRHIPAVIGTDLEVILVMGMLDLCCGIELATPALHVDAVVESDGGDVERLAEIAGDAARFNNTGCAHGQATKKRCRESRRTHHFHREQARCMRQRQLQRRQS